MSIKTDYEIISDFELNREQPIKTISSCSDSVDFPINHDDDDDLY